MPNGLNPRDLVSRPDKMDKTVQHYSLVCVGPGRKPEQWFSHDAAQIVNDPYP